MPSFLFAKSTFFLMEWLAWVLQWIINALYWIITLMTTPHAMPLTILLMTLVVRAAMTPLTYKQQISSRRMQRLQPQQQAIQEKYKNKTDPEAQQKMQAELQELYSKNQASPFSGCLPLLIQMPILFALYEILRNIPFYVNYFGAANDLNLTNLFEEMAKMAQDVPGIASIISENYADVLKTVYSFAKTDVADIATNQTFMMDFLYHLSGSKWDSFLELTCLGQNVRFLELYELQKSINTIGFGALTFNLADMPTFQWAFWKDWSILFPVLAAALTFLQSFIIQEKQKIRSKAINPNYKEDQSQKTSKIMLIVSPVMILIFAFQVPLGLSLYWIASSLFGIISQEIVDAFLDKKEYKEALAKKTAYLERQEVLGLSDGRKLTNPKTIRSKSSLAGNKNSSKN